MRKIIRLTQGEITECAYCERDAEYRVIKTQTVCCSEHLDDAEKQETQLLVTESSELES